MHPCADQNANIPYHVKMREENDWSGKYVWLFGPETSIKTQIDAFGDHDIICGNINPPLFQSSTYEEILEICRENIEEGINAPNGYILSSGCEFPPNAAPIKVMAMVDAAEMYGKYVWKI